jgi:hypothetical protein
VPLITDEKQCLHSEIVGFNCDCCGKEYHDILEIQEAMIWKKQCGYGSVFGDGNVVEMVICQYCTKGLLGRYIRDITES